MTRIMPYYVTRAALSLGIGALFVLAGSAVWAGVIAAVLAFVWFLLAPRIGRYGVRKESGAAALQHDERGGAIRDAAARNAFVVSMLSLATVILYHRAMALSSVPIGLLLWILVLGTLVYFASDLWARRAQA